MSVLNVVNVVDTLSIGVIVVTIHRAVVEAADMAGKSGTSSITRGDQTNYSYSLDPADPYVTASFAKYGKPLFSTRIIMGETEPVWRASTMVLVKADAFKVKEKFALRESIVAFSDDSEAKMSLSSL
jgi:hypothetical protein